MNWRPTHRLGVCDASGWIVRYEDVQLCADESGAGPAYTRSEWEATAPADWEREPDGSWTHQGIPWSGYWWELARLAEIFDRDGNLLAARTDLERRSEALEWAGKEARRRRRVVYLKDGPEAYYRLYPDGGMDPSWPATHPAID